MLREVRITSEEVEGLKYVFEELERFLMR